MSTAPLTPDRAARFVVDAEPWLSCDDCFDLVDGYVESVMLDRPYSYPEVAAGMQAHLRGCTACFEEAAGLLELAAGERGLDPAAILGRLTSP